MISSTLKKISWIAVTIISISCQPHTVTRVEPDTQIDLSGRWNDTDSRMVAEKMINDLFVSERFKEYAGQRNNKPV